MSSTNRRLRFLREMGIDPLWTLREKQSPLGNEPGLEEDATPTPMPTAADAGSPWNDDAAPIAVPLVQAGTTAPSAEDIAQMDWEQLQASVSVCTKCRLCETRTRTVFGAGTPKAKWLFIGEGPGYNEDQKGEPFIGAAGRLLDNMLAAMDLKRGVNAYIANIVKCRPTDASGKDRPPTPEESNACMPYLERQIALIQPSVIVALGKTAAISLLGMSPETPVSKLRGTVHRHGNIPLVVTYHPAYLLRKLDDKGKAWRDLCLAMTTYASEHARA